MPERQLNRWRAYALRDGVSLSEFVRKAVESQLEGLSPQSIAAAISLDLLPEMERLLVAHAVTSEPQIPLVAVPRSFDRGCFDAELHKPGIVCQGCGGSTY